LAPTAKRAWSCLPPGAIRSISGRVVECLAGSLYSIYVQIARQEAICCDDSEPARYTGIEIY